MELILLLVNPANSHPMLAAVYGPHGFFAYMLWSAGILLPVFAAITFLFLT
jgi:hypothetical protein